MFFFTLKKPAVAWGQMSASQFRRHSVSWMDLLQLKHPLHDQVSRCHRRAFKQIQSWLMLYRIGLTVIGLRLRLSMAELEIGVLDLR